FRPCLLYAINQCTAPCADKITKPAYRDDIDRFVRFLGTKRSTVSLSRLGLVGSVVLAGTPNLKISSPEYTAIHRMRIRKSRIAF
ncbi:MAG: hypothetical protein HC808_10305, partial [Candidatus Competibacteraceae bacterium]|nr:hypothetical protein [Candidatus Competibacteraceae bacterium]